MTAKFTYSFGNESNVEEIQLTVKLSQWENDDILRERAKSYLNSFHTLCLLSKIQYKEGQRWIEVCR